MTKQTPQEQFSSLSARQKEVLHLICQGTSYKEIAEQLVITKSSVKSHMREVYKKFDLLDLARDERIFRIRSIYCPMFDQEVNEEEIEEKEEEVIDIPVVVIETEPEPEPVSPDEDEMLDADEKAIIAQFTSERGLKAMPQNIENKKRNPILNLLKIIINLIIIVLAIVGGYTVWQYVQGLLNPESSDAVIPFLNNETTYELGEWVKQEDVWIRLSDYEVARGYIFLNFEIWNQSDKDIFFSWTPQVNFSMIDNKDVDYEIFDTGSRDATFESGDIEILSGHGYSTVSFADEPIFDSGVTDLYITVEYLSVFDKMRFHINVGE